jgi:hypothetical protein
MQSLRDAKKAVSIDTVSKGGGNSLRKEAVLLDSLFLPHHRRAAAEAFRFTLGGPPIFFSFIFSPCISEPRRWSVSSGI